MRPLTSYLSVQYVVIRCLALCVAACLLCACATAQDQPPVRAGYPVAQQSPGATRVAAAPDTLPQGYSIPDGAHKVQPASPSAPQPPAQAAPQANAPVARTKPVSPPKENAASRVAAGLTTFNAPGGAGKVHASWVRLVDRLRQDPSVTPEMLSYFDGLPEYSPVPMGVKVKELFTGAFLRRKGPKPTGPRRIIYRNVVTAANVATCDAFLTTYASTFSAVEKKYPVPKEILVALLFVETRLGNVVGKENAFWSLACMAAATAPEYMTGGLEGIPITAEHASWLQAKLTDKSDWAYKEMRALLKFCSTQQLDPRAMPGSVYGAIGICQFMPSNLVPYGDDGDGDGLVNLFSVPDAVFSAALYLTKHGWKTGLSVAQQRQIIKRYNNLTIYANTILTLAESVRTGTVQSVPPDMAQAKTQPSGKTAQAGKAKGSGKAKAAAKPKDSGKAKGSVKAKGSGKAKKTAKAKQSSEKKK